MINALITGIFSLIAKLGDIIISPLVNGLTALIPSFGNLWFGIRTYLGYGFQYIGFAFKLLCVPTVCINAIYTVATVTFAMAVLSRAYTLIIRIYNKFKV